MSLHSAPQLLSPCPARGASELPCRTSWRNSFHGAGMPAWPSCQLPPSSPHAEPRGAISLLRTSCSAVPKMRIYAPNETEVGSLGVISRSWSDAVGMGSPGPLPGRWARPLGAVGLGPTLQPRPREQSTWDERDPRCLGTQLSCWSCCAVSLAGSGP